MQPQYEFSRGAEFQRFLESLLNPERFDQDSIIGVTIEFHPMWWRLATFWHQTGGIDYPYNLFGPILLLQGWPLVPQPDPAWAGSHWAELCKRSNKKPHPYIVRICYRPGTSVEIRGGLSAFAREQPFFCMTQERPLAIAASGFDGGRELVANEPGTLGGFFKDKNNSQVYGITCGHVGQASGTFVSLEDSAGAIHKYAGIVSHTSFKSLTPLASGQACNRSVRGITSQVDVALVQLHKRYKALNTVPSIGKIDEILDRTQFGSGDPVQMRGAVSKHNAYYVGAYDVVYKVLFKNGKLHCFEHMFEINRQADVSPLVPPILTAKAVHGDSGACICRPSRTGNFAYCGTLVAVDGTNGYACFAETVRSWAAGLNPSIDLVPL